MRISKLPFRVATEVPKGAKRNGKTLNIFVRENGCAQSERQRESQKALDGV